MGQNQSYYVNNNGNLVKSNFVKSEGRKADSGPSTRIKNKAQSSMNTVQAFKEKPLKNDNLPKDLENFRLDDTKETEKPNHKSNHKTAVSSGVKTSSAFKSSAKLAEVKETKEENSNPLLASTNKPKDAKRVINFKEDTKKDSSKVLKPINKEHRAKVQSEKQLPFIAPEGDFKERGEGEKYHIIKEKLQEEEEEAKKTKKVTIKEDKKEEEVDDDDELAKKMLARSRKPAVAKYSTKDAISYSTYNDLAQFNLIKVIGKGTFGKVLLVSDKKTNKLFAMKVLKKEHIVETKNVKNLINEKKILNALSNNFIIKLHFTFQSKEKIFMAFDYHNGGELFYHLQKKKRFSQDEVRFYASEIFLALFYMHNKNIIYRDIKPENIIMDKNGHIRIVDFGLAKKLDKGNGKTASFCGTNEYIRKIFFKL